MIAVELRAWIAVLLLAVAIPRARADTAVQPPAAPNASQALAAAKRLWSAIRSHKRERIAAAVGERVRTHAGLVGLGDKNEVDVERARFADQMRTLDLGGEPAGYWHPIEAPPLAAGVGVAWVGAEVESSAGVGEGHGARTAALVFGVRVIGGRALVVAFDATYGESHLIYSR